MFVHENEYQFNIRTDAAHVKHKREVDIMSQKIVVIVTLSAFLISMMPSFCLSQDAALQDVLYLKNGSVIRGVIIEQIPGQSVKIRTADGSVFVYQMSEIERIAKEEPGKTMPTKARKEPVVACALSIFLPGLGQFYNGQYAKGALMLGAFIAGALFMLVAYVGDIMESNHDEAIHPQGTLGALIFFGTWIWSVIDAPISASKINRKNGWTSLDLIDDNLAIRLADLAVAGKTTPGVQVKWDF